ncbi:MAG TPA: metallophosphoesterase [Clostridiales bacterium]|nr:metallophosphoesterase [Clostridiales bacterium]
MKIFALADLHLSLAKPFDREDPTTFYGEKPMDVFGSRWDLHIKKIYERWQDTVSETDLVLIAGDISWAMTLTDAGFDLDFVSSLKGRKIMIRGNHDYWWHSLSKIRAYLPEQTAVIQNDAVLFPNFAVCGTRLWTLPTAAGFGVNDEKIYKRELIRQELSLEAAGGRPVINMNHFMPVAENGADNEVTELFRRYRVFKTVYGHLHDKSHSTAFQGPKNGTSYYLTSADYLDFRPLLLMEV